MVTSDAKAAAIAVDVGDLPLGGGLLAIVRPALDRLPPGGVLAILSSSRAAREDLPSFCRVDRHEYLGCETIADGRDRHLISRGGLGIPRGPRDKIEAQAAALRRACVSPSPAAAASAGAARVGPPLVIPPLCTSDLECGPGRAVLGCTEFPDLMALGANDSEDLAFEVGKATALEARAAGINWSFSPCVDFP